MAQEYITLKRCPRCKSNKPYKYYDGCLGYESFVCTVCGLDKNDIVVNYIGKQTKKGGTV